jgi:hypothetical protein
MSVADELGVAEVDGPIMIDLRRKWPAWVESEPNLGVIGGLLDLRIWTRTTDARTRDAVLRSLAKLGSPSGSNDAAAATALSWVLVPGAAAIARRMSDLAVNIDQLVASHLWTAARTFAWERRQWAATSILRETARGVQAEVGVGDGARRHDRTWLHTAPAEPASPTWTTHVDLLGEEDPLQELQDLLVAAIAANVITVEDRALLVDLAVAADEHSCTSRRGQAGLMTATASETVAARWGLSSRTVRRRVSRSIDRLAAFSAASLAAADGPRSACRLPVSA